jgi:hypothetical protein
LKITHEIDGRIDIIEKKMANAEILACKNLFRKTLSNTFAKKNNFKEENLSTNIILHVPLNSSPHCRLINMEGI